METSREGRLNRPGGKEDEELWKDDVFNFGHLGLKVNARFQRY